MRALNWRRSMAYGLLLLAVVVLSGYLLLRPRSIPDTVESFGSFEVVTHHIPYLTGWNEGRLHTGVTENYALRYRGQPFAFDGKAGPSGNESAHYDTFNAVITFPPGTPMILLNVGDPNNRSYFYLAREIDGKATAQFLGEGSGGVSVDWLDPPANDAPRVRDIGLHRGRLAGGRWLILGESTVFDLQSVTAYPLARAQSADDPSVNEFKPAIAMSPDQQSFVRFGYTRFPESAAVLIVFGVTDSSWYMVPIRRRVERFNEWAEIDGAWLNHYYEWRREAGAADRLIPRPRVTPWPYRGYRLVMENDHAYQDYSLKRVAPEMRDTFLTYLEQVEGATRLPDSPGGSATLTIGSDTVHLTTQDDQFGLWMDRAGNVGYVDRADKNPALVYQIGDRFDAVLATGVHDELFLP